MFSRSTEYALRALALLSLHNEATPLQSGEIAAELGLPPQFLTKVLRRLAETDLVSSRRGRSGGFRLTKAAEDIPILAVVEVFEGHISGLECVFGMSNCSDRASCALHGEWNDIRDRLRTMLEKTTLADIAERAVLTTSTYTPEGPK